VRRGVKGSRQNGDGCLRAWTLSLTIKLPRPPPSLRQRALNLSSGSGRVASPRTAFTCPHMNPCNTHQEASLKQGKQGGGYGNHMAISN
jgi:hypothetical protein